MGGQTKGDYAVIQPANLKNRNKAKADAGFSIGLFFNGAWLE